MLRYSLVLATLTFLCTLSFSFTLLGIKWKDAKVEFTMCSEGMSERLIQELKLSLLTSWENISLLPDRCEVECSRGLCGLNYISVASLNLSGYMDSAVFSNVFNEIIECHIRVNSDFNAWYLSKGSIAKFEVDAQSAFIHELGHCLGLAHSEDTEAVMYKSLNTGVIKRALSQDDLQGYYSLYPLLNFTKEEKHSGCTG